MTPLKLPGQWTLVSGIIPVLIVAYAAKVLLVPLSSILEDAGLPFMC